MKRKNHSFLIGISGNGIVLVTLMLSLLLNLEPGSILWIIGGEVVVTIIAFIFDATAKRN